MSNMTETKAPAPTKKQLEEGKAKWQRVVDHLYMSLHLRPGSKESLTIFSHRRLGLFEETIIRHIHAGEYQIAIFDERIAKLRAAPQAKTHVSL